jgi:hypothetical protein
LIFPVVSKQGISVGVGVGEGEISVSVNIGEGENWMVGRIIWEDSGDSVLFSTTI